MSITDIDDQSSIDGWTQNNSTDESDTNNSVPSSASDLTWLRNDLQSISEKMDTLIVSIQHAHNDDYKHKEEMFARMGIFIGGLTFGCALFMFVCLRR